MQEVNWEEVNNKIADLLDVIDEFADLLEKENAALKAFDVEAVGNLFEQKAKTVGAYRSMSAFFIKNQNYLSGANAELKAELKDASKDLDELLKENELLLKTRMETSKNVMDTIINIAKVTNNRNATSYGARGNYSPQDNSKNALAINRTL
ncbi:MAG: hypothetical protein E7018_06780 [Alphaproteobacteria bacterium]|nr:hypothetical protein [Alphaproteobacteria bacterium]